MPLTIHIHHHHLGDSELLLDVLDRLDQLKGSIDMIAPEVQALMDQAKKNTSITASLDAGFKALTAQVANLQGQIASLQAGSVLSDADKQAIQNTTDDLAASFSTLSQDIPANTPAAPPAPAGGAAADPNATGQAQPTANVTGQQ